MSILVRSGKKGEKGRSAGSVRRSLRDSNSWQKCRAVYDPLTDTIKQYNNKEEMSRDMQVWERANMHDAIARGTLSTGGGRARKNTGEEGLESGNEYEALIFSMSTAEGQAFNMLDDEDKSRFVLTAVKAVSKDTRHNFEGSRHAVVFDPDIHEQTEKPHLHMFLHKHSYNIGHETPIVNKMHGIDTNSAGNDIVQNIRNALAEEGFNFIQIADYREGVAAPNADGAVTPLESIQQVKENLIGDTELLQMSDIAERRANDKLSIVAELRRELEMAEIAAAEELKIKAKIDEAVEVKKQMKNFKHR